ncbi:hypothetical protein K0M31_007395 [Melipona bicolor]|uniref:Uncharacterized protein n=1 Tax=Melipona bicolor TaxID=60889 RepID=A0AA40GBL8_9HYME|nr:hypothetical protein K0M31_007395 [Melipona bicolor]
MRDSELEKALILSASAVLNTGYSVLLPSFSPLPHRDIIAVAKHLNYDSFQKNARRVPTSIS